jgi:hypothetical protein
MKLCIWIQKTFTSWNMTNRKAKNFYRIAACEWSERNGTIHRYMRTLITFACFPGKRKLFIRSLHASGVNVMNLSTGI